jgi:hypothetical protein
MNVVIEITHQCLDSGIGHIHINLTCRHEGSWTDGTDVVAGTNQSIDCEDVFPFKSLPLLFKESCTVLISDQHWTVLHYRPYGCCVESKEKTNLSQHRRN